MSTMFVTNSKNYLHDLRQYILQIRFELVSKKVFIRDNGKWVNWCTEDSSKLTVNKSSAECKWENRFKQKMVGNRTKQKFKYNDLIGHSKSIPSRQDLI